MIFTLFTGSYAHGLRRIASFCCFVASFFLKMDSIPSEMTRADASLSVQQVIYRALPKWESLDPFGVEGQQQLRVTNVRIRLLKRQPCPCQAKDLAAAGEAPPTRHFAIYDLIVKGSCFCNGHAEQCVTAPGYQPVRDRTNHVVRQQHGVSVTS